MDWTNERYVRLYTRDTDDWLVLSWQAKALFPLILRKVDRSGYLATKRGAIGVAAQTGLPLDLVEVGLPDLIRDGSVTECDEGYLMPNYIEAQEAPQSDAQRARDMRERRRARFHMEEMAESQPVASASQNVTGPQRFVEKPSLQPSQPVQPSELTNSNSSNGRVLTHEQRVVIAANQVYGSRFPNHTTPHTPGHVGTGELVRMITEARIPIEFAERSVATQASKVRAPVKTMAYYAPGILEQWARHNAKLDAGAAPRVLPLTDRNESRVPSRGPSPPVKAEDDGVKCPICRTKEMHMDGRRMFPKHQDNCPALTIGNGGKSA